ncbi:heparin lyase I family protein [Gimesia fumaroli]|uniref:Uncharacterized protein n=1 Tax=Gimesia fumaroli TaxID=2527976 RepID=A0A518IJL6_9PLAN|nr:heparin lyase I family protein [Gimesia fumaroli]QDV53281.1 hypothetical protein Enr17x_53550 [Gimesia fumaroli]
MLSNPILFGITGNIRIEDGQAVAEYSSNGRSEARFEQTKRDRTHVAYSFRMERPAPGKFLCVLQFHDWWQVPQFDKPTSFMATHPPILFYVKNDELWLQTNVLTGRISHNFEKQWLEITETDRQHHLIQPFEDGTWTDLDVEIEWSKERIHTLQ